MFYNFFALGDDEFEELSRDILSRELDQKMRIFGKGADQGIDIADCKDGRTIIAQCKNYINTPTSDLMSALEKEKDKVEKLNPKEYYLFINKDILNICSFQGHCYCRRRPIALFDDYCGSRPPLLRIKATGC